MTEKTVTADEPQADMDQMESQPEPSEEEIKQARADMMAFFEDQKEFLEKQVAYEESLMRIEEARTRRIMALQHRAQSMGQPQAPTNEKMSEAEPAKQAPRPRPLRAT